MREGRHNPTFDAKHSDQTTVRPAVPAETSEDGHRPMDPRAPIHGHRPALRAAQPASPAGRAGRLPADRGHSQLADRRGRRGRNPDGLRRRQPHDRRRAPPQPGGGPRGPVPGATAHPSRRHTLRSGVLAPHLHPGRRRHHLLHHPGSKTDQRVAVEHRLQRDQHDRPDRRERADHIICDLAGARHTAPGQRVEHHHAAHGFGARGRRRERARSHRGGRRGHRRRQIHLDPDQLARDARSHDQLIRLPGLRRDPRQLRDRRNPRKASLRNPERRPENRAQGIHDHGEHHDARCRDLQRRRTHRRRIHLQRRKRLGRAESQERHVRRLQRRRSRHPGIHARQHRLLLRSRRGRTLQGPHRQLWHGRDDAGRAEIPQRRPLPVPLAGRMGRVCRRLHEKQPERDKRSRIRTAQRGLRRTRQNDHREGSDEPCHAQRLQRHAVEQRRAGSGLLPREDHQHRMRRRPRAEQRVGRTGHRTQPGLDQRRPPRKPVPALRQGQALRLQQSGGQGLHGQLQQQQHRRFDRQRVHRQNSPKPQKVAQRQKEEEKKQQQKLRASKQKKHPGSHAKKQKRQNEKKPKAKKQKGNFPPPTPPPPNTH